MKTAVAFFALLSAIQPSPAPESSAGTGIPASKGEFTPEVEAYVARGDALCSTLRFGAAAREYARAVARVREQGHLASGTTWMLANAHFHDGNYVAAAAALDQLTEDASHVGDLAVEALALYNSAWLYGKAGRRSETVARVTRLQGLLRSPYMPIAIRDQLNGWLSTWTEVAAK